MKSLYKVLKRAYNNMLLRKEALVEFKKYFWNKEWNQTYSQGEEKGRLHKFFDLSIWIVKYSEFHKFYYLFGQNIKGADMLKYYPYSKFRENRNQVNIINDSQKGIGFNYLALTRDKFVFSQYLQSLNIPTVKNIYYFTKNKFQLLGQDKYLTIEDFFQNVKGSYFCKELSGEGGQDSFSLTLGDEILINNEKKSIDKAEKYFKEGFLVQELVAQHKDMDLIHTASLNTIRIVTIRDSEGNITVNNAQVRCGTGNKSVDNWWVGGLICGISDKGVLSKKAYFKPGFGTSVEVHPDSKIKFENYQIPYWNEVEEIVKEAHKYFYSFFVLGWDVALTENGPILIEVNEDWEITLPQATGQMDWEKTEIMFKSANKKLN